MPNTVWNLSLKQLRTIAVWATGSFLLLYSPHATAQTARDEIRCDAAMRAEIIDSVSAVLRELYVFPSVAEEMSSHISQRFRDGIYDEMSTVSEFTRTLAEDLRQVSQDQHIRVWYAPPALVESMTNDTVDAEESYYSELARENYYFKKVEILDGNVGFLRFDSFIRTSNAGEIAIAAMNFLANTHALIVDLRNNGGGSPSMIQLIASYFFDTPRHLNSYYIPKEDRWRQYWTLGQVQGPRMTEVDLYVLTSPLTFSAAEWFAYSLKHLDRATIVGHTTRGGAHPTEFRLIGNVNTQMLVPFGESVNPITESSWEGVGVIPDVQAENGLELELAHMLALEKQRETEEDDDRRALLDWLTSGLRVLLDPVEVGSDLLASYAGDYGPHRLIFENGSLWYQRPPRPRLRAVPMTDRLFCFEEMSNLRVEVVTDSLRLPTELVILTRSGRRIEFPRSEP